MLGKMFTYGGMLALAGAVTLATPGLCQAQRPGGGNVGRAPLPDSRVGGSDGNFYRGGYRYGDRPYYGLYGGYPYSYDWPGVTYGSARTSYSVVPDPYPYDNSSGLTYASDYASYSVVPEPFPYDNPNLQPDSRRPGSSGVVPAAYLSSTSSSASGSRISKLMQDDTAAHITARVPYPDSGDSSSSGAVPAAYGYSSTSSAGGSRISKLMQDDTAARITAHPESGDSGSTGVVPAAYLSSTSSSAGGSRISTLMQPDMGAYITARVPADARLWFDGLKTTSTGLVRRFHTPPLAPGSRYAYEVRARWNENGHEVTQTQMVEVTARADVDVNFPVPPKTADSLPSTISRPAQKAYARP